MRRLAILGGALMWLALAPPAAARTEAPPATDAPLEIRDDAGRRVATVVPRPGAEVVLPAGRYTLVGADGSTREVMVDGDAPLAIGPPLPSPTPARASSAAGRDHAVPTAPAMRPSPRAAARRAAWPRRRLWVAPLVGALVPGAGHLVVRRPPSAIGIFAAALGLGVGAVILGLGGDRHEGATLGDRGSSAAREAVRQGAFVLVTDALALLWLAQAADAHRIAAGKPVRGRRGHAVALSFARTSTVGLHPGEPAIGRYDDYAIGVVGQVAPRWHVGITDLTLHTAGGGQLTLQAGARAAYRVLTRDRIWLLTAFGILLQGTSGPRSLRPIRADAPAPGTAGRFGAVPYVQLETRIFVLPRLSIDVAPRLSVPLTTRSYGRQGALPRYAPTFELSAGAGVYF